MGQILQKSLIFNQKWALFLNAIFKLANVYFKHRTLSQKVKFGNNK